MASKTSLPSIPKIPKPKLPNTKTLKTPTIKGGLKGYLQASKMP